MQEEFTITEESAIRGLMLLGRTREEAVIEVRSNYDKRIDEMKKEWANHGY